MESELRAARARSASRYRSRALNSLQTEGREESIATDTSEPPLAPGTGDVLYAGDRYSRTTSRPTRTPPRFSSSRVERGRSPSLRPRTAARRPGDPLPPRSGSRLATRARAHAIVPYDPVKNADACFNCGNKGHRTRDCQHPKDEKRVQANLELFRKHRTRLVAALNMLDSVSKDFDERSEDEGSECYLPTGDTTEQETDLDETEDEGSDLEHEYEDEDSSCAKGHHP